MTPVRNSRLVDVSFDSEDPKLSAAVASALAAQYIQMNFETKYDTTNAAADFMAGKLIDLKARVEKSEESLAEFGRRHNIYAVSDKENVTMRKLSDLNSAMTAAQTERIQKESVWNVVRQTEAESYPEVLRNDLVRGLEKDVSALQQKKMNMEPRFKPGWFELDQVTSQLADAEKQLAQEKQRALKNAETEYRTAVQKEELLLRALDAQKVQVDTLNQDSINAVNFLDGADGVVSTAGIIMSLAAAAMAMMTGRVAIAAVGATRSTAWIRERRFATRGRGHGTSCGTYCGPPCGSTAACVRGWTSTSRPAMRTIWRDGTAPAAATATRWSF